ncbi:hypothetical protein Sjap_008865 [Stephania japonica]|uniref:Uncharacterized protein n=1 Tax=Stephania japonica TaxID=461633 RepID=A0AAP0JR43_9MAGN
MAGNNIVLDAVVGDIVERVVSLAVDEIGLVIGVENEVRKLKAVLTNIQAVLQDAERKQGEQQQQTLRVWLHDLKQIAYDAEDVLDKIAYKELKYTVHNKVVPRWLNPKRLVSRGKIAHEIKAINQELDVIDKRRKMFQLESNNDHSASSGLGLGQMITYFDRETASYVKDSSVIGRESDKEEIIKMLINGEGSSTNTDHDQVSTGNNMALPVIAIVGLGGLGKTTLAQFVYNDAVVEEHFELRVWICVSTHFRTTSLFFQILQQINRGNTVSESSSKQVLLDELKIQLEQQGTKKLLLVLDDDWNEDQKNWEEFALPLGDFVVAGSKIIITSRDQTVASVRGSQLHLLQGLSEDSCWDLIESQAFKHGGPQKTGELVKIGKKISEKCKGVPLVAKVLGGLLYSKNTEVEWLAVQNAKFWDFNSNSINPIMEVLKLSYNNLPLALKPCFSYCAIFPKDYSISKALLIELWMAQGLLGTSDTQGGIMEDKGNTYFNILYSKSFFQEAELNKYGEVIRCKMHDLLNDLAQSICKFECHNFGENMKMSVDLSKCRHVSFISPTTVGTLCKKAKKVRTIFGWESDDWQYWVRNLSSTKINTFFKFKLLRVLDLSSFRGSDFSSSSLGKLKHLRYLDLSKTSIESLPKWVTRLYQLQTLKLINCYTLKELPQDLMNLKKLRHLFIDDYKKWKKVAEAVGELHQLQTLPLFVVCEEDAGRGISVLKNLNNLRGSLKIHRLSVVKEVSLAKGAKLSDKGNLRALSLHWDGDNGQSCVGDSQVLKELQPHRNLKELSIVGFGGVEFPRWVSNGSLLPHLVAMKISDCSRCKNIPSFGELPSLERLEIRYMRNVKSIGSSKDDDGMGMDTSTYGSLKELRLEGMGSLEEWSEKEAGILFPCLEELYIWNCPNLRRAPHLFPSLQSLRLVDVGGAGVVSITSCSLASLTSLEIEEFPCRPGEIGSLIL